MSFTIILYNNVKQAVVILGNVGYKNLFKEPYESLEFFVHLLYWKTWDFHQGLLLLDKHINVGSSSFFFFSLLLQKSALSKLSREK